MTATTPNLGMLDAMQIYFQGEKIEALVFILPLGLLSIVFSAWLLTDNPSSFARGVATPFLLMGLLMTTVGAVVGYRAPGQVAVLEQTFRSNPQVTQQTEAARMDKINKAWPKYLAIWTLFGIVGLALRFATSMDFLQGLGIALVFFAGVGLMVDGFAERRTHPYIATLGAPS
jgi:hypothetical protein